MIADFRLKADMPPFLCMRNDKVIEALQNVSRLIKHPPVLTFCTRAMKNIDNIIQDVVKITPPQFQPRSKIPRIVDDNDLKS